MLSKKSGLITGGIGSIGRRHVKTMLQRFLRNRRLVRYGGQISLAIVRL